MQKLTSYLSGTWQAGEGAGSTLYNPTTGEGVATASTTGLDLGAALTDARAAGAALRKLTFVQRASMLKAMSKAIHAQREALIEVGRINCGNTRGDAKFDIDGATATLMHYANQGADMGDRTILLDGEPQTLGRAGTRLQGQHIRVPRPGVAIHINAFNFPCWGLAEKAACALLAGMPILTKPATATAWMTWHLVRAVVEADVLPKGALSLLCGSVGDLLDHVGPMDVIAFTGGEDTGRTIRSHPAVIRHGVPVNVEADSLNAVVLGAKRDDETYDAFIRHVATELTQKAGQKCTATRRIFVPKADLDEVIEDLGERLGQMSVGDPGLEEVRVGPLASKAQLASAKAGLAAMASETRPAYGDPFGGGRVGVTPEQGFFMNPTLLRCDDPFAANAVHAVEVFGPMATLMPYDGSVAEAVALVQRGRGSLVTAVYGDDRTFLSDFIIEAAGWNGRVVVTDAKVADAAFAPGLVMPQMVHGGPGRAGGGVELGDLRGMGFYQQTCGIQGNGPLLSKLLDR